MADGFNLDKPQALRVPAPERLSHQERTERLRLEVEARAKDLEKQVGEIAMNKLRELIKENWVKLSTLPTIVAIWTYLETNTKESELYGPAVPPIPNDLDAVVNGTFAAVGTAWLILVIAALCKMKFNQEE